MNHLSNHELKKLSIVLDALEIDTRKAYHRINGGFATAELFNYDDNIIDIELKFGTQDDTGSYVNSEQFKIDRRTMKIID